MMGFIIMFSYMYLTYSNHTSAFITLYCSPPTPFFLPASPFSFLSLPHFKSLCDSMDFIKVIYRNTGTLSEATVTLSSLGMGPCDSPWPFFGSLCSVSNALLAKDELELLTFLPLSPAPTKYPIPPPSMCHALVIKTFLLER